MLYFEINCLLFIILIFFRFVEKIQTVFKILYEGTLKGTSLILPLMAFMILEVCNIYKNETKSH